MSKGPVMMGWHIYVQKLVRSLRASLSNVSVFGLNGWRKPESVKTHFRAVVFRDSFSGY